MEYKLGKSWLRHVIVLLLFAVNCFTVQGFTLKSCRISFNNAICSGSQLTEVPTDIPPTVGGIDLSINKISKLQVQNFMNFTNVTNLNLIHNQISKISKGTFSQLISLKILNLNNNKLDKLDNGIFDGLSNLTELRVGSNGISIVAPDAFKALKNVLVLDLSGNKLRSSEQVGSILKHLPLVTNVIMQHNSIKAFKSSDLTNKSTNIRLLDISLNPTVLFQITTNVFPNLTKLSLGNPPTTLTLTWDVPDKAVLPKVDTLDVSRLTVQSSAKMCDLLSTFNTSLVTLKMNAMHHNLRTLINKSCSIPTVTTLLLGKQNNLHFIGSSLFVKCTNVTTIDLSQCKIKEIHNGSFTPVSHLRILTLAHNKLQNVSYAIRNLRWLSTLQLTNNSIQTLECNDFENLTNLQQLSLQWNRITSLSKCVFQNLPKLQRLELQGNSLAKLNEAFHASLPNLKLLRLNENSLTTLKTREFSGLPSLENLFLFQNQISKLEEGCFIGLNILSNLQLYDNKMKKDALDAFKDLVNLKSLNIGKNYIKYQSSKPVKNPPFLHLSKLKNLALQAQQSRGKSNLPSNLLQGLTNLSEVSFRNIQLIDIPDDLFIHTPNLESLDLNSNDLMEISHLLLSPIPKIKQLRLSLINLRSLDFVTDSNLTKLEFLQARKNAFSVITTEIIKSLPSLRYLDLKYNSFICDCNSAAFVDWIRNSKQTEVFDAYSFKCYYPPHQKVKMLLDLNVQSCTVDIGFICYISTTCLTVVHLVASLTYRFMRFQLVYAYYIFLAWLHDRRKANRGATTQYDAFVSYNVHDEVWVCEQLLPHLEEEQGWKLCLHHRDFQPGKPIVENITDAIYGSRKTLCVISRKFLQSEWCSREMQVASFRLFDEKKDVLLLVFLEDIPSCHLSPYYRMRRVLKRQTYLRWPGAEGAESNVFWEKLRQALTKKKGENTAKEEERLLLTVTDQQ